jgi:hypothetical protein
MESRVPTGRPAVGEAWVDELGGAGQAGEALAQQAAAGALATVIADLGERSQAPFPVTAP